MQGMGLYKHAQGFHRPHRNCWETAAPMDLNDAPFFLNELQSPLARMNLSLTRSAKALKYCFALAGEAHHSPPPRASASKIVWRKQRSMWSTQKEDIEDAGWTSNSAG